MARGSRTMPVAAEGPDGAVDRAGLIRERLFDAIMERRLPPGTRLPEDEVGTLFAVSRTVVRAALQALAHDGVVQIERNRGAFVARPAPAEAREVFGARRLIEPDLAAAAAGLVAPADIRVLRGHLDEEMAAMAARGPSARRAEIVASGRFHLHVAAVAGNAIVLRFLRELIARSSLVIALYGRSGASSCARDEHAQIVAALEAHDTAQAAVLMRGHLEHIEADLDYRLADETPPLRSLLLDDPAEGLAALR